MMLFKKIVFLGFISLLAITSHLAWSAPTEQTANISNATPTKPDYLYYGLDPDIVTNYDVPKGDLGFIRIHIVFVIKEINELHYVEHYTPLIRDALIQILNRQKKETIMSASGQEQIRQECLDRIHALMVEETGHKIVYNLLFTKYLYQ